MRLTVAVLGIPLLTVSLEDEVEETEEESLARLGADLNFGFAPDPVFPELEWEEDDHAAL